MVVLLLLVLEEGRARGVKGGARRDDVAEVGDHGVGVISSSSSCIIAAVESIAVIYKVHMHNPIYPPVRIPTMTTFFFLILRSDSPAPLFPISSRWTDRCNDTQTGLSNNKPQLVSSLLALLSTLVVLQ